MLLLLKLWGFVKGLPSWVWVMIPCVILGLALYGKVQHHFRVDRERTAALAKATTQLRADAAWITDAQGKFKLWNNALTQCETTRRNDRDAVAQTLAEANRFGSTQASTAYRLGRASCGAPNAQRDPAGRPAPGRVPDNDFRSIFEAGAFTPTP